MKKVKNLLPESQGCGAVYFPVESFTPFSIGAARVGQLAEKSRMIS